MVKFFLAAALLGGLRAGAQDYRALHTKAIVVDSHNDVLSSATLKGMDIGTDLTGKTHSDLARHQQSGVPDAAALAEFREVLCEALRVSQFCTRAPIQRPSGTSTENHRHRAGALRMGH